MLEVEVLEISHDRLQNLGIQFPNSLTVSTPESATTVGAFKALTRNDLLVSSLSLGVNLKLEDSDSNILASPRIRARNKEKARILIGDRVPIITNSVTPMSTGAGVVTGSVTYQDVGLKLEFEPQIYSDQEVGITHRPGGEQHCQGDPGPERLAGLPDRHAQCVDGGAPARWRDADPGRPDRRRGPQCFGANPGPGTPADDRQAVRQQQRQQQEDRDRSLHHAANRAPTCDSRCVGAQRVLRAPKTRFANAPCNSTRSARHAPSPLAGLPRQRRAIHGAGRCAGGHAAAPCRRHACQLAQLPTNRAIASDERGRSARRGAQRRSRRQTPPRRLRRQRRQGPRSPKNQSRRNEERGNPFARAWLHAHRAGHHAGHRGPARAGRLADVRSHVDAAQGDRIAPGTAGRSAPGWIPTRPQPTRARWPSRPASRATRPRSKC